MTSLPQSGCFVNSWNILLKIIFLKITIRDNTRVNMRVHTGQFNRLNEIYLVLFKPMHYLLYNIQNSMNFLKKSVNLFKFPEKKKVSINV